MKWIVLYENYCNAAAPDSLPGELAAHPVWDLYLRVLSMEAPDRAVSLAIPETACTDRRKPDFKGVAYPAGGLFSSLSGNGTALDSDFVVVSNGRYLKRFDEKYLLEHIALFPWDVLTVQIAPSLESGNEIIRMTSQHQVVGFRRLYVPGIEPMVPQADWPVLMFIKRSAWDRLKASLPSGDYPSFLESLRQQELLVRHVCVGGQVWDLSRESGWFEFLEASAGLAASGRVKPDACGKDVRIVGNVHIGRNVRIGDGCVLIAPAVLSDGVTVGAGSVLRNVWLGPDVQVPENYRCQNRILLQEDPKGAAPVDGASLTVIEKKTRKRIRRPFRNWSRFSYPVFGKRIFDFVVSCVVMTLFLPFLGMIAAFIKLASPGPVFYRARRQGLHGKEFDCLKFRTMMVQADAIQDKLRVANQVDGPQFKIEDDPRITRIGKFLRDTSIDEIPQFFNVIKGEMSIVGPRPSPESENETCPYWRDARLSVRPGITGLWQVMRTRQVSMDFQEWIYYDTSYVRKMSFGFDIWICLKTAQKLIHSFLDQFG